MPFAVFRQHQKKMLAIIAILAMSGFVLSDSLYRLSNRGGPATATWSSSTSTTSRSIART